MAFADYIRYAILCEFLVAAGFLLGLMTRGPGRRSGASLYGFGTSYLLLLALGAAEVTLRLDQPISWRTVLAFISGTVAAVTMVWINVSEGKHNGRRWKRVQ